MSENRSILEYQRQSINTMSKGELLVRLFDEALKNIKYASILMKEKNDAAAKACTEKCIRIFNYLCVILDRNYEISGELYKIYSFLNEEIIKASVKRDASVLDGIIPLIQELHDTWSQANKLTHMQNSRLQSR